MKRLLILVLAVVVTASDFRLGDRIASTEKECQRIYDLNKNWSVKYFNEQAAQYIDLYFICIDSLNEDKYKYIDDNKVDLSWYPGENDRFPVETQAGTKFVSKPPARQPEETESMKKTITEYLKKTGGTINPIYKLMNMQSGMGQEIVDQQVECDSMALKFLKNRDDKEAEQIHNECINKLNCMKERFMDEHLYTREVYQDFFPIMYKNRGTMIKTPPKLDKSSCEPSVTQEGSKGELDKWMKGVEYIGKKLSEAGEAGSDLVQHLMRKGIIGGEKILSRKELDDIMNDAQSVEILDDDGEDDGNENVYKVYGNMVMEKLAALESKGLDAAHSQVEKAKPVLDKVQKVASTTAGKLQQLEQSRIKPAVEKTTEVIGEVKNGIATAGKVAKTASSKVVNGSSEFIKKLNSYTQPDDKAGEEDLHGKIPSDKSSLIDDMIQPEYLPEHYDENQAPTLLQLVKDMGKGNEAIIDKMSEKDLEDKIKALKLTAKKRLDTLHLTKEEILKSANIVKGVMHVLLTAAGQGAQADMKPNEVEKAKSLVDEIVNYATAELINKGDKIDQDDEEEDFGEAGKPEKNQFLSKTPLNDSGVTKENEPMKVPSIISTSPAENPTSDQTLDKTVGEEIKGTVEGSVAAVEKSIVEDNNGEGNQVNSVNNHGEVQKVNSGDNHGEEEKPKSEIDNHGKVEKISSVDTQNEVNTGSSPPSDKKINRNDGEVEQVNLEDNHDNEEESNPDDKKDKLDNDNSEDKVQIEKANDDDDGEFVRGIEYTAVTIPEE